MVKKRSKENRKRRKSHEDTLREGSDYLSSVEPLTWRFREGEGVGTRSLRWTAHIPKLDVSTSPLWLFVISASTCINCFMAPRITQSFLQTHSHAQVNGLWSKQLAGWRYYLSSNTGCQAKIAFFVWGGSYQKFPITRLGWPGVKDFIFVSNFYSLAKVTQGLLPKDCELFLVWDLVPNWQNE